MKLMSIYRNVLIAICILCLPACDNQWDDHTEVKNGREKQTIMQVISSNPELSTFASILKETGYDTFLSGDKSVTVFAPKNSALESIDLDDEDAMRALVRNHIAFLSHPISNGQFQSDDIEMINTKRVKSENGKIDGLSLLEYNLTTSNGLLHIIDGAITTRKNIWEYLLTRQELAQISFVKGLDRLEMDMDKSIQTGIDEFARPVYDTVWVNRNPILERYPLDDETLNFTFVLLNQNAANSIEAKYAKYFIRPTEAEQDSLLKVELFKDCVLLPVEISANGKYMSVDGVNMDISTANIIGSPYEASNGIIYELSDADVKVYENKLKTFIIEAEDYRSYYADGDAWAKRSRSWASGGIDMMLNSQSRNYFSYVNEEEATVTQTFTYYSRNLDGSLPNNGNMGRVSNCYIEFRPTLNSIGYKVYVVAHDDIAWHYDGSNRFNSDNWYPMVLEEKMLISFPDEQRLVRNSEDGTILNNFSTNSVFVAKSQAYDLYAENPGETDPKPEESQLLRYNVSTETANQGFFIVPGRVLPGDEEDENVYQDSDEYGDKEVIICPRYGESTLFIANTVREKGTVSGMIFLDYIKFVPQVDEND